MDSAFFQYTVLIPLTIATSVVTLFTGFGVGTIMMPAMMFFFDVKIAIFLSAIVHVFNNISRLALYWAEIKWNIIKRFGMVSLLGAFIGSFAQIYMDGDWLKMGVGLFLMVYALISLFPVNIKIVLPESVDIFGGFLSGLIGGLIGNQGAIRSIYLLRYGLKKQELIVSAALIAVIIDATRIPVYAYANFSYLQQNLSLMSSIVASSILGTIIGSRILPRVSHELFKKIILVGVLIAGILMLLKVI